MNITELNIIKFRHLTDIKIDLGERLTAIAGQNGTGKSTILGLLGHICKEKTKYRTFDGKMFETEYSEIFKFSFPEFDKPKEHLYEVSFDDGTFRQVVSYSRKATGRAESLRLRVGQSTKEGGKVDFPVIFLGLKRLNPLAQEKKVDIKTHSLTPTELEYYAKAHNEILLMNDEISSDEVKTSSKHFIAARSENYDALGNSAGQDNIGQIITSIISFQRLKSHLGESYKGGVLLIDELDASLFPAAQKKLIEFLFKASSQLELQVIFTTHSIEILEQLLTSKYKHQSNVCYFHKSEGPVKIAKVSKLPEIIADLKVEVLIEKVKDTRIEVYLEDKEAQEFLKSIINPEINKKIKIIPATFGAKELLHLVNKKIPAFKNSLIVLDGDMLPASRQQNVIVLPGGDSPEKIIFNFLKNLEEGDTVWGGLGSYTKQFCFKDLKTVSDREKMKAWWRSQISFWGRNGGKVIKYWKLENAQEVEKFNNDLNKKLEVIYKKIYK